ncbi:MAG TPA: circadian clock protein KaiC [Candidatus Limnocylindrales bacterium]|nr:circadian clock protein KaiC [Candidatus Limnocylindrales bacterium]
MSSTVSTNRSKASLKKTPSGISGFDEITGGGLPLGRPALVCGGAGCGKTLFASEFLVRGAQEYNEPGVFIAFEETAEELASNVASLGFDLNALIRQKKLCIDHVHIERSEIQDTGDYDLEGLFIRLNHAIDSIGAKRVVLDTLEALFSGLPNEMILRSELRRLFRWLKEKGVTAVITAERGNGTLTRYGLEEYVADCVIFLDHRVQDQISTRRLRILKYRGSLHGTNEYPFLIGERGISILPVTSLGLSHVASRERISSGVPRLDTMLGGRGFYRGSSVLVSGTAGSGKTTLAAHFVAAACVRGERALYFAFEESASQIQRNMLSIGLDLGPFVRNGLLHFQTSRPTYHGLEMHLVALHDAVQRFHPQVIIIDPITNLTEVGTPLEVKSMLTRLIDFFKSERLTAMFSSLTAGGANLDQTELGVSSLMDTWIVVRNIETGGERNRALYVLKARGLAHSNQVREFVLSNQGVQLIDVYSGDGDVLVGSARVARKSREREERLKLQQEQERRRRALLRRRKAIAAQIAALRAELESEEDELKMEDRVDRQRQTRHVQNQNLMCLQRSADVSKPNGQSHENQSQPQFRKKAAGPLPF